MKSPRNILTEKKKELMTKPQGQQQSRLKKSHTGGSLPTRLRAATGAATHFTFFFVCLFRCSGFGLGWVVIPALYPDE